MNRIKGSSSVTLMEDIRKSFNAAEVFAEQAINDGFIVSACSPLGIGQEGKVRQQMEFLTEDTIDTLMSIKH